MVDHVPWQAVPVVWAACGLAWAVIVRREQIARARNRKP